MPTQEVCCYAVIATNTPVHLRVTTVMHCAGSRMLSLNIRMQQQQQQQRWPRFLYPTVNTHVELQ